MTRTFVRCILITVKGKRREKGKTMDMLQKQQLIKEYCDNDMYKLNKLCRFLIKKKNVPQMYEDDLYSIARLTFVEAIETFDCAKNCKFQTYLIGNIWKAFYDWTRDNTRWKRCNLQTDGNGKLMRDENNRPVIIPDVSLDAVMEEDVSWCERIPSDFDIEKEVGKKDGFSAGDKIETYLKRLSKRQREMVLLLSQGYTSEEIREALHLSTKEYGENLLGIRAYENVKILY